MTNIINYLFEANISLIVILIAYRTLLAKENSFRLMRFFLLSGMVLSAIFPLLHLDSSSGLIPSASALVPSYWLPEIILTSSGRYSIMETETISVWRIAEAIYWIGFGLFTGIFIHQLISLKHLIRKSVSSKNGSFTIAESTDRTPTFSFFNFIFIGDVSTLSESEKQDIINHESIHARQLHSLDVILIRILQIVFWFNPLIKSYQKYLVELHEYEADARAVADSETDRYCSLLARVALQSADFSIANHFNNSLTLKRITMIRTIKRKVSEWKLIMASAVFPLLFFILGFQDQVVAQQQKSQPKVSTENTVYSEVDEMPVYGKGFEDLVAFLGSNMKYPDEARKNKIEGTVFVDFVVEKDGKLTDVKLKKGLDPKCDAEALRVVKLMNNWNPGLVKGYAVRTNMVLPIKFKLN
jgi:TonB family protein